MTKENLQKIYTCSRARRAAGDRYEDTSQDRVSYAITRSSVASHSPATPRRKKVFVSQTCSISTESKNSDSHLAGEFLSNRTSCSRLRAI
ncbi:hypothetical protein EVAR_40769_1 [Eumeta japonica]|uniref:Uncharacterized protein n=1 Tax=Eumeta variegata TaxID=151549 RepID=A0A4C1X2I3_EUMVA|nr:hypothetical protein EVAR_40769_1 [Eumeta japonica]